MGNKPDISHIQVFGCVAHMKVPSAYITKLDDCIKVVVYLGMEPGTKGRMLYNPSPGKFLVIKDVVFEEHKTWA